MSSIDIFPCLYVICHSHTKRRKGCDRNHISNLGIVHFKKEIPRLNESGKEVFFKELHCKLWQYIHI